MDRDALVGFLGGLPPFRGLDAERLDGLAAIARTIELDAGQDLFREGEPSAGLFAVAEGAIKIHKLREDGRERILHRVGPGRTFAEAVLFHGGRYPARWTLSVPSHDLELDIRPILANQELSTIVRYWEGAVDVEGRRSGERASGRGYVELTGYAD